jgi:hypothetical protein
MRGGRAQGMPEASAADAGEPPDRRVELHPLGVRAKRNDVFEGSIGTDAKLGGNWHGNLPQHPPHENLPDEMPGQFFAPGPPMHALRLRGIMIRLAIRRSCPG